MSRRDHGLSKRLQIEGRRIAAQHRRLGELWQQFVTSFDEDLVPTRDTFFELRAGLIAHFDLEERIQIPALHGSNAELQPQLTRIVEDHTRFRTDLEELARLLEAGVVDDLRGPAMALLDAITEHEALEQTLFPGAGAAQNGDSG